MVAILVEIMPQYRLSVMVTWRNQYIVISSLSPVAGYVTHEFRPRPR